MNIRLMNFVLRDKLLFILFGTNNWNDISRFLVFMNNANVRLIEYKLQNTYINFVETHQYKLYRYAKEIAESNILQLQNVSPDINLFSLDQIKRNTRSCVEAYINMISLLNEPLFLNLYNRECKEYKEGYSEEMFREFLNKYGFRESDVLNYDQKLKKYTYVLPHAKFEAIKRILEARKLDDEKATQLIYAYRLYNKYSHSNIYANKQDDPEVDSKNLLETNLYILKQVLSYFLQWVTMGRVGEYEEKWEMDIENLCMQINEASDFLKSNTVLLYTEIPQYQFR